LERGVRTRRQNRKAALDLRPASPTRTRHIFLLRCSKPRRCLVRDKVYVATLDGKLIAIDKRTGTPVWTLDTVDIAKAYSITGAPRIVASRIVIGNAGAENGVRGCISAYDAETGKLAWRFYTVPGDPSRGFESKSMEAAAKTWRGECWKVGGGGTVWDSIAYDPALDLLYFGTGNAAAWYPALRGGGDNLHTASIVALRRLW